MWQLDVFHVAKSSRTLGFFSSPASQALLNESSLHLKRGEQRVSAWLAFDCASWAERGLFQLGAVHPLHFLFLCDILQPQKA